jgi:hypothetical protein
LLELKQGSEPAGDRFGFGAARLAGATTPLAPMPGVVDDHPPCPALETNLDPQGDSPPSSHPTPPYLLLPTLLDTACEVFGNPDRPVRREFDSGFEERDEVLCAGLARSILIGARSAGERGSMRFTDERAWT